MKAYKVELLIIDHDKVGRDEIANLIENANYPNDCIGPHVMHIEARDIGEFSDDHPLNQSDTQIDEFKRLFMPV
jgi:hypothetical protein